MAVNLSPVGGVAAQFFNNDGTVLSGGKLNTYTAGTTTPATTYTTSAGVIAHSNPIVLNSAGRVPGSGEIWLTDGIAYKFVLTDANNVLIATYDNISGINSNFINFTSEQEIQTATAGQTVFTLTTMQYQPGTGSLSVFVDGVNQYGPGAQYAFTETSGTVVTFVTGLHVGASVKFTTSAINAASYGNAFQISYTPPFNDSVTTNVGDKLAQVVSVMDFGAVGDGIADDTLAIQNAIDSFGGNGIHLYIPSGTYKITSSLNIVGNVNTVFGDGGTSVISPAGAIDAIVIGDGVSGINFGTFRDFKILSSDGLQTKGIWGRSLRQFHFVNIIIAGLDNTTRSFSVAAIQTDDSYSCNLTSVTAYYLSGKGFWLGQDPAVANNQANDFTLTGCQAFLCDDIGFHIKGSGNSLLGCLGESCDGGAVRTDFAPGINISGGYFESNGATSGYAFYITTAQNAGGISNCFINNVSLAGTQCIVLDDVDTFVISGCNFRVNATGIGVELDANVSNVYLISNRDESALGTLYGGVSYPASAHISDTFVRFDDIFATDFKTDSANKKAYSGRLSATPGDGTIFEIRGRQGVVIFAGNPNIPSITSTAIYSTTVGATNRDVFVDNTGLLGYVTSTRESKKNIQSLEDVSWLLQLDPVSFNRRKKEIITDAGEKIGEQYLEEAYQEKEYGLIADDVEAVNKELCFYDDNKLAGVHYQKLITPLLKLVQDLHNEIEVLKQK